MPAILRRNFPMRALGAALAVVALASSAKAEPSPSQGEEAPSEPLEEEALDPSRFEPGLLPALSYDSDLGFGFGAIGTLARFDPGFDPYRYRLQAQIYLTLTIDEAGQAALPYHHHYIRADFPGLLDDRLRIGARLAFGKFANAGYYGIGQLAERRRFSDEELEASEIARRFHTYDHATPNADVTGRIRLFTLPEPERGRLELLLGLSGSYHLMTLYEGSKLEADAAARALTSAEGARLAELLRGVEDHGLLAASLGLVWDSRDHEFAPSRGTLTELSSKWSPGVDADLRYVRLHFSTRWFAPVVGEWLVFAHRTALDWLLGDPPIYELAEYGVLQPEEGPGGSGSVRGILLRRYHGKAKIIENVELRAQAPWFTLFGERWRFGAVAFADAGRVWSDLPAEPALDGPWAPFALGVGGGLRIRWGETLVMRLDGAYSPTDETEGFYVDLGHVF